jgi:hypothetical protein
MVWAIPRRAPSKAYFELEVHPAPRVVYTFNLDRHKNKITPKEKYVGVKGCGYKDHRIRASIRANLGEARKGKKLACRGLINSFKKSFAASARGCGSPSRPTLLGPFRIWK